MPISFPGRRNFLKTGVAGAASLFLMNSLPDISPGASSDGDCYELRYRQIHMDYHNNRDMPGIGERFDPDEFASTLAKAHVNSVTCFGLCCHGWIYHATKKFPERKHPHLSRNLLEEQIEACHKRDIRVPIYVIVQWDYFASRHFPEWIQLTDRGAWRGEGPYEAGFHRYLCLNTPYVDFLKAYIDELFETVPVDGLFLDIVHAQDCSCKNCRADMEAEGIDPSDPAARKQFGYRVYKDFISDMTNHIRKHDRNCSIFYNSGHIGPRHRDVVDYFTHFEIESLPSGFWGYLHFPMSMRYARNLGVDCMGMTGKFHTTWGDFHSLKNKAALEFECYHMLALNGKCSIGDQLHPGGKIDKATYELIGSVYSEVEKKEPWCIDARPVTEIGVLTPEEFSGDTHVHQLPAALGVVRMLQEGKHQFDMLDSKSDFSPYRVLVLPDHIPVSIELSSKLSTFLSAGGAIISTFESGLNGDRSEFSLKVLGVRKNGEGPLDGDGVPVRGRVFYTNDYAEYIIPRGKIGRGLPETEHVMYIKGLDVDAVPGAEIIAHVTKSYFDRSFRHFISHRQTPSSGKKGNPAIVRNGRTIYFSHPIFTQYHENAPRWCRVMFINALDMLLPEPLIRVEAPSTTIATINEQQKEKRWIVHLLNYIPERRGRNIDIIEDVIPLYDINITVKVPGKVKKVEKVPLAKPLKFTRDNTRVEFVLDKLDGHQMIAMTF